MSLSMAEPVKEDLDSDLHDLDFVVFEDLAQELEDFIYMARLGCIDEALELYDGTLKSAQYKHFPIYLEYLSTLIDIENFERIVELIDGVPHSNFSILGQKSLLKGISLTDKVRESAVDERVEVLMFMTIPLQLSTLEYLVQGVTRDQFNTTLWLSHTMGLTDHLKYIHLDLAERKLLFPFYRRCCEALNKIDCSWEAFRLLQIVKPYLHKANVVGTFRSFFAIMTENFSKPIAELDQPVKLTYLAGLVYYLKQTRGSHGFWNDALIETSLEPRRCNAMAQELFGYFFQGLENARGQLFESWTNVYNSEDNSEDEANRTEGEESPIPAVEPTDQKAKGKDEHNTQNTERADHSEDSATEDVSKEVDIKSLKATTANPQSEKKPSNKSKTSKKSKPYRYRLQEVFDQEYISPKTLDTFGLAWAWTNEWNKIVITEHISKATENALASYTKNDKALQDLSKSLTNFTERKEARQSKVPGNSNYYTVYPPAPNTQPPPALPSRQFHNPAAPSYYPPPNSVYYPPNLGGYAMPHQMDTNTYGEQANRQYYHIPEYPYKSPESDPQPASSTKPSQKIHTNVRPKRPRIRSSNDVTDRDQSVAYYEKIVEREVPIFDKAQRPIEATTQKPEFADAYHDDDSLDQFGGRESAATLVHHRTSPTSRPTQIKEAAK